MGSAPMSSTDPLSPPKMSGSRDLSLISERISSVIDNLKQQVAANWRIYVKKRMEENKQNLDNSCKHLLNLSQKRRNIVVACEGTSNNLLIKRLNDPISQHNGSSIEVKNDVDPIQFAQVKRIPPYTTWIFLDKNQRMTEDQSVVGRRRIYYDQSGEEALICSDSEEEKIDEEEYKKEFNESEDYILRMTMKEAGSSDAVLDALAQCFLRKPFEIKERYEVLAKSDNPVEDLDNPLFDKDLNAALDSFDTLFCRRCFVFDCRLHGCSQDLIYPAEKLLTRSGPDEENDPCGPHCYKVVINSISVYSEENPLSPDGSDAKLSKRKSVSPPRERRGNSRNVIASSSERNISERNENQVAKQVLGFQPKRQRNFETSDSENGAAMTSPSNVCNISQVSTFLQKPKSTRGRPRKIPLVVDSQKILELEAGKGTIDEVISRKKVCRDEKLGAEGCGDESMCKLERKDRKQWKTIETSLYQKGLEIFGRNSCLIARNLMNSMKTCSEVFQYMNNSENRLPSQPGEGENHKLEDNNDGNTETMGNEGKKTSRYLRRRGRVRRLKYKWKSAGYHLSRKRISDRKDQPRPQYNPCGCESTCGKECPCHVNGTCCEKYCGCPKTCKNRFRGCHCAKSQCQSRQCPCFAADRECDPDICRNCWINCGDGSLGVSSQKGDNYECMNMKLLLGQRQRILLGPSDVSGWGAFLKNSVAKNELLGEYTGEVISQQEADKRGKIYDREDQSYLFNLNDQLVVDAFRRGDKLKFANHSAEPNCSAKVMTVAGDHRVAIFSKERIKAGEELFYDYCYAADRAPSWAKKPEEPGSKKEETGPSKGRARKLA